MSVILLILVLMHCSLSCLIRDVLMETLVREETLLRKKWNVLDTELFTIIHTVSSYQGHIKNTPPDMQH